IGMVDSFCRSELPLTAAKFIFRLRSLGALVQPLQLGTWSVLFRTTLPLPVSSLKTRLPAPSPLSGPAENIVQMCPPGALFTSSNQVPERELLSDLITRKSAFSMIFNLVFGELVPMPTRESIGLPLRSVAAPRMMALFSVTCAFAPIAVALLTFGAPFAL